MSVSDMQFEINAERARKAREYDRIKFNENRFARVESILYNAMREIQNSTDIGEIQEIVNRAMSERNDYLADSRQEMLKM